ncbi:hypothetical protein AAFP30_22135 [Gordonia sp. CPCC 205515]|uniref:hypothetical protein n=1 Tax=Gordonia sp. CPCC 205515 TaxID=3140791 RepID=UPI003AF3E991
MTESGQARSTAVVIRSIYGTASAEWFIIFAIGTILVTRAYLQLTGYPQVGGGDLHIAHALYGGALMMLALLIGWLFLGPVMRVAAVVLGGIGFGLFLDEVGKFVTKTNDYFYGPSAEIMYILVVLILLAGRVVRDVRKPTVAEALANAATIASDGISHGLPQRRRHQATQLLALARDLDADPQTIATITTLLDASTDRPDRLMALRHRAAQLIPNLFRSPRWLTAVGWLLVVSAGGSILVVILGWVFNDRDMGDIDLYFELNRDRTATWILFVASIITFALALPAMIARNRTTRIWPLRVLHFAALISVLSNALVDFALEGFGALTNLAVGLFALAIINYHLGRRTAALTSPDERDQLRV